MQSELKRILGVDPGSRLTGYGCIETAGNQIRHIAHGTLNLSKIWNNSQGRPALEVPFEERLLCLYQALSKVILELKPEIMVVEKVFFAKSATSALKLGQARGATLLTGKIHSLKIAEYSPTEVKLAVTGYGHADKGQVAQMVTLITSQRNFETPDASDALALAICHSFACRDLALKAALVSGGRKKKFSLAESVGIPLSKKTR